MLDENETGGELCSFSTVAAYARALSHTPQRLAKRLRAVGTAEAELNELKSRSGTEMQRELRWYDVMGLGVGGILGAGIFVSTGKAAHLLAGPAIIASYAVAGLAALLSAACYTEFAVEVPAAGGAFSYLRITFGELAAFLTGANLVMEYVISNAAVARSFTSYFATVFSVDNPDAWRVQADGVASGYIKLDFPALALVSVMTFFICRSTKNSCTFNILITILHLALIAFIIVAGFTKGNFSNLTKPAGFTPFGAKGIFNGAAAVFYSYVGYDSVSTLAEETHKPAKTMPICIAGSVVVVTLLYCLLGASLVLLVPYDQIDVATPFPLAFRQTAGWTWASNLVGVCACVGIVSSLMVAMLGQARYLCVISRANVVPAWFARVNRSTGTPVNASISLGACTAIVALFTELDILLELLSISILFVFYMVANALIARRHVSREGKSLWPTVAFLVVISGLSVAFVTIWQLEGDKSLELAICGGALLFSTAVFKALVPPIRADKVWEAPMMPFVAVASVFLNVFLASSLKPLAFKRFGIWSAGTLLFYLSYSVHAAHDAEEAAQHSRMSKINAIHVHESIHSPSLQLNEVVVVDKDKVPQPSGNLGHEITLALPPPNQ